MAISDRSSKSKYRFTPRFKKLVAWVITFVLSVVFIWGGSSHFSKKIAVFNVEGAVVARAKITEVGDLVEDSYGLGEDASYDSSMQYFTAKITSGEHRGEVVTAIQTIDNLVSVTEKPVEKGDHIILYNYGFEEGGTEWIFGSYSRLDSMIVFGIIFCILLLVFGKFKGLNTIISLAFTCLACFAVFIPAVLSGANIYLWSCIICIFTIIMTLMIVEGPTEKGLTTILGCSFGVAAAAIMTVILDKAMFLTGMLDEHSVYLTYFEPPINLNGVVFAMVVIGALGAVMDVAMDISSSLHEIHVKAPGLSFKEYFRSGITIGRDIMGTMANTLVLAYIGSSLCSVLLMISYSSSLRELLNREGIIVEIMNGLIGSCAILLTIPLTSLICGMLYGGKNEKNN